MVKRFEDPFAAGLAWVEGAFVPLRRARIPLVDAGLLRSDATYDVVSVWEGKFFRLDEHLDRFQRNCSRLRMSPPLEGEELRRVLLELVGRSGLRNAYVDMIATRGLPSDPTRDLRQHSNRLYLFACPYLWVFSPEQQERGVSAVVSSVIRTSPLSLDPTIKNFQWGDLLGGVWEALDAGAEAGILLDVEGNVTEGAGYNVFGIVGGVLRTPAEGALLGITRRTVLELAQEIGLPARIGSLSVHELRSAEEIFFTTTAGGVMPVGTLDGQPVGSGRPGPNTLQLKELYWEAHSRPEWTAEVDYSAADRDRRPLRSGRATGRPRPIGQDGEHL
jgi:branched-chain amino acid aminotransferase